MDKISINFVYRIFAKKIGESKTELNYRNPYTFLVSVVLSAKATDKLGNNAKKMVKNCPSLAYFVRKIYMQIAKTYLWWMRDYKTVLVFKKWKK